MPKPELFNEWTGLSINLALLDEMAVMVEHANSGFVQRDVEANNLTHGSLRSIVVGASLAGKVAGDRLPHLTRSSGGMRHKSRLVMSRHYAVFSASRATPQQAGSGRPLG